MCFAQSAKEVLPDETKREINNALSSAIDGMVVFGTSSAIGSGYFTLDAEEAPDTDLDVLRLFNDIDLENPPSGEYHPFLNFGIGSVKVADEILPYYGSGPNDFTTFSSLSFDLGVGVDIKLSERFFLTPMFDLVYTHTENEYDYNNESSQTVLQPFDGDIFNWDVDTLGYNPGLKLRYEHPLECSTLIPSISYTEVFVESFSTSSDILDVSTASGIMNSRVKWDIPDAIDAGTVPLTLVPQISRTDLYGDVRSGINLHYFQEISLAVIARNQHFLPAFKDIGVSAGITLGDDVSGWRLGLEGEL